ncbi:MAG: hypothetical protein GY818_06970 [Planctomycetaceae bacterium]|nr:hypothetical protein [Planctomycetaceae bacterium]
MDSAIEIEWRFDPKDTITMLTTEETESYFHAMGIENISIAWLKRMRTAEKRGLGPEFKKIAGKPYYTKAAIHEFIERS